MSVTVVGSTDETLAEIKGWLEREDQETGEGFICNWSIIARSHAKADLTVAMLGGSAAGFLVASRSDYWDAMHIMSVDPSLRRRHGIGTALTHEYFATAQENGSFGILIECAPTSSASFWERVGFRPIDPRFVGSYSGYTEWHRQLAFPRSNRLPSGRLSKVRVDALPDFHKASEDGAVTLLECDGVTSNGKLFLEQDFLACLPSPDVGVRVLLGDEKVCVDKTKYLTERGGERRTPFVRIRSLDLD